MLSDDLVSISGAGIVVYVIQCKASVPAKRAHYESHKPYKIATRGLYSLGECGSRSLWCQFRKKNANKYNMMLFSFNAVIWWSDTSSGGRFCEIHKHTRNLKEPNRLLTF